MDSTLTLIALVVAVLLVLLIRLNLKDLNTLKRQVYDLVSFSRNGNPSKDEMKDILKRSSYTPPFSDLTLEFVLRQLLHEGKITTSTLRVTCGTDITYITTYVLCASKIKATVGKHLHSS